MIGTRIHRFSVWLIAGKTSRHGLLRGFDLPANYEEILAYNLAEVARLLETPRLVDLRNLLCEYTGIRDDQMKAVIARQVLVVNEWNREVYAYRAIWVWAHFVLRTVGAVVRGAKHSERGSAQVLFGDWSTGGHGLYTHLGHELDQRGISHDTIDVTQHDVAGRRASLRGIITALRLIRLLRGISVDQQITLHSICAQIVLEQMIGEAWGKRFSADVFFTLLDNGSLFVRSHAAGMKLVLAQNGTRCGSDACFIVASHYLPIEPTDFEANLLSATGVFQLVHAGALSIANQARADPDRGGGSQFDILWVSQTGSAELLESSNRAVAHNYPISDRLQSTRMVLDFAHAHGLRIAYFPRDPYEVNTLVEFGLDLSHAYCIDRREMSIYQAITLSKVTLSCFSTALYEAMHVGKTAGFVYASPNMTINQYARDNGLLYSSPDPSGLDAFLRDLPIRQPVNDLFIVHPTKTHKVMADVIESALVSADSTSASSE